MRAAFIAPLLMAATLAQAGSGQDPAARLGALDTEYQAAAAAQRPAIEARAIAIIDGSLSAAQVDELCKSIPKGRFTRELVVYKRIRLLLHKGQYFEVLKALNEYTAEFPQGRFAADVARERGRLEALGKVQPRSIGVLFPLSGEYRAYGEQMVRALRLAIAGKGGELPEANEGNGEGVYRTAEGVSFIVRDTAADPVKAVAALDDLVLRLNVVAVIGPVFTGESVAVAARAVEFGVPVVTLSRKEGITEAGPWVFRNCLTNSMQAAALARYAMQKMGFKTFALMYPNIPYGVELANYFWDAVEALGGEVTGVEMYENDQTTFTMQAKKLAGKYYIEARQGKNDVKLPKWADGMKGYRLQKVQERDKGYVTPQIDFDAIFIPDYFDKVSMVVPALAVEDVMFSNSSKLDIEAAMKATGFKDIKPVQLLGGNGWNSDKLTERAGKGVDGAVFIDGFFAGSEVPETKTFVDEFRRLFGQTPGLLEAQAYDTARIFMEIEKTAKPATRDAMRAALLAVKDFPAASGRTTFMPNGEARKELFILAVEKAEKS
ncbi:MAG: ABC transporter substrate-binding protein, partial [Myxococcota bacterium]